MRSSSSGFDPRQAVVLEGEPGRGERGGAGRILGLDEAGPNRIHLIVSAPQGGWLVLADGWFPGWSARIDGEPAAIYAANGLFRALWLPLGEHSVQFAYLPGSVVAGLGISALAWPALLVLLRRS